MADYDWRADSIGCFNLALRLIALRRGVIRFKTIPEMYWIEQHGGIP
jgi:hypothetical protein